MRPPEQLSIGDVFANRYPMRVPKFQRGYAWQAPEVDDFIGDVRMLLQARSGGNPRSHFLGGIVTIEHPVPGSKTGRIYDVIDGQQRLATWMVALSRVVAGYASVATAARGAGDELTARLADSSASVDAEQLIYYEEVDQMTGETIKRQRLTMSRADAHFFTQLIEGQSVDTERESHHLLRAAFVAIQRELVDPIVKSKDLPPEGKWRQLQDLLACLRSDCYLVHIGSEDRNEAYRLFMTLNSRGRALSEGELLRAWTLELLDRHEALQVQAEREWDIIVGAEPSDVDSFLRDFYASHQGERASKRGLFDQFKDAFLNFPVRPDDELAQSISQRAAAMRREFEIHARMRGGYWPYETPEASAWEQDRLDRLISVLRRVVSLPFLMALYFETNERTFGQAVHYLERADFRYLVCGGHAGTLGDVYYAQAKRVRDLRNAYQVADLIAEVSQVASARATDDVFRAQLGAEVKYGSRYVAHFLTTLDAYYNSILRGDARLRPERMTVYDLKHLEIEHIYPQNPDVADPELEPLKHDLGNLTFWGPEDNKAGSNTMFAEKKESYARSAVALTRELADLDAWNADAVRKRRNRLIDMALRVFTFG